MATYIYLRMSPKAVAETRKKILAGGSQLQGVALPNIAALSEGERRQWEHKLKKTASDCGCTVGATVGVILAAAYAVSAWYGLLPFETQWTTALVGAMVLALGGSVGKLLGIALARRRLRRLARQLTQRVLSIELAARES